MSYLKTEKLSVGYNGQPLIRDIDLEIGKGEIVTLIGPNGSGKSTLLKSITRHLSTLAGTVFLDGRDMGGMSPKEIALRLSVVLTERIQPEMMTCFDVVSTGRYPYTGHFGRLTENDRRIIIQALERVRAADLAERDFTQISDGQRQRIMLARAICQEPEIIVLDEPTSFLDIRYKTELLDILGDMARERGITVVMSLHEIDLAYKISDKIICVKGDHISRFGSPAQIFTPEVIADLYGLENGSYNITFGSVELGRPRGEARVFVLGGNGCGAPHYRELQRRRIPFATGILWQNDIDCEIAKALAVSVLSAQPFAPVPRELIEEAKQQIRQAGRLLNTGVPLGEYNCFIKELLDFAAAEGIPILSDIGEGM